MDKHINLASLSKDEALLRARAVGRAILGDEDAVSAAREDLMGRWFAANMPYAVGQTDDEFNELVKEIEKEFEAGVDEAIKPTRHAASDETSDDMRETAGQLSALLMLMSAAFDDVQSLPEQDKLPLIALARDLAWRLEDHLTGGRKNG